MGKKLVLINGSPRKNGNSAALAGAFIQAAEDCGHSVFRFDAAIKNVGGCHACGGCFRSGRACCFDDDFNLLAPHLAEADGVIFVTPVYWYSFPAQLKAVIDKLFSFFSTGRDLGGKQCALIACCAEPEIETFDGIRVPYIQNAEFLHWEPVGEVLVPGVAAPGDVAKTDGCTRAAVLAKQF